MVAPEPPLPTGMDVPVGFMPIGNVARPLPTPKAMTAMQLSRRAQLADSDPNNYWWSFGGRVKESFFNDSYLGRFLGGDEYDVFSDEVDPTFQVTPELVEKYASDLSEETQERLLNPTFFDSEIPNFGMFIEEVEEARLSSGRRAQVFEGAPASGMAAMFIGAMPEAAVITAISSLFTAGSGGTSAPVTGPAALAGLARLRKLGQIVDKGVKSARARAAIKTGLTALTLDVPLEILRYRKDKTLTSTDLFIGMAAAGTVGTALSQMKPQWFDRQLRESMRRAAEDALIEEAAGKAGVVAVGKELGAERASKALQIKALRALRLRIKGAWREVDEMARKGQFDEIKQLADQLGVKLTRDITSEDALAEATTALTRRINRLKGTRSRPALERLAKKYGVETTIPVSGISQTLARQAKQVGRFPRAVGKLKSITQLREEIKAAALADLRQNAPGAQTNVPLTNVEIRRAVKKAGAQALKDKSGAIPRVLTDATDDQVRKQASRNVGDITDENQLKGIAGKLGVLDRDALAKAKPTRKNPKARLKALKKMIVDGEVKKWRAARKAGAGATLEIDGDILNPYSAARRRSDISPEMQARIDRRKKERGVTTEEKLDKVSDAADRQVQELKDMVTEASLDDEPGLRNTIANLAEGWFSTSLPGRWWAVATASISTRLMGLAKEVDSPFLRDFVRLTMDSSGQGGYNAAANARRLEQAHMTRLANAEMKAGIIRKRGGGRSKFSDAERTEVIRKQKMIAAGKMTKDDLKDWERAFVDGIDDFFNHARKYANKHNLFSKEIATTPPGYFHRIWRPGAISEYLTEDGDVPEALIDFFERAIQAHPDFARNGMRNVVSTSAGKKVRRSRLAAERILSFMRDPEIHHNHKRLSEWVTTNKDELSRKLGAKRNADGTYAVTTEQQAVIDDIIDMTSDKMHDPVISQGRARIHLDETFESTVNINGNTVKLSMFDFTNNNIYDVAARYSKRMHGAGETRKAYRALYELHEDVFVKAGVKLKDDQVPSFEDVKRAVKRLAKEGSTADSKFIESSLNLVYRTTTGLPIYEDVSSRTLKTVIRVQSYAQASLGQLLGFAQLPEVANIMAKTGLHAAFQQFELGQVINTLAMGLKHNKDIDPLLNQLGCHIGVGFDYEIGETILRRIDDHGLDSAVGKVGGDATGGLGALDKMLETGRNISMLNPFGIVPMDTILRRWATKANFQHFVDQAYKANKAGKVDFNAGWWRNSKQRFRELGLSEEMVERINRELLRPEVVKVKSNAWGRKVVGTDLDKMNDLGAYDALCMAMRRQADNQVQRHGVGDIPYWMQGNLGGKFISQYRVFGMAAKSKQFAQGIRRLDVTESMNLVGSMLMGSLSYIGLTAARYPMIDPYERDAWWEERMSMDNILKSAVVRASYFNIIPQIVDAISVGGNRANWWEGEPVFNKYMRSSESLGLNPITGSTAYSMFDQVKKGFLEPAQSILQEDNPLSQQDMRNFANAAIIGRVPVIGQFVHELIGRSNAPRTDKRW